jgi:hypothetical protein
LEIERATTLQAIALTEDREINWKEEQRMTQEQNQDETERLTVALRTLERASESTADIHRKEIAGTLRVPLLKELKL